MWGTFLACVTIFLFIASVFALGLKVFTHVLHRVDWGWMVIPIVIIIAFIVILIKLADD